MINEVYDPNAAALERVLAWIPENYRPLACKLTGVLSAGVLAMTWLLGLSLVPLMVLAMAGVLQ